MAKQATGNVGVKSEFFFYGHNVLQNGRKAGACIPMISRRAFLRWHILFRFPSMHKGVKGRVAGVLDWYSI